MEEFIDIPRMLEMIPQALGDAESEFAELTEEMALNGPDRPEEIILSIRCAPFRDRNWSKSGGHHRGARHYRPEADGSHEIPICLHREP